MSETSTENSETIEKAVCNKETTESEDNIQHQINTTEIENVPTESLKTNEDIIEVVENNTLVEAEENSAKITESHLNETQTNKANTEKAQEINSSLNEAATTKKSSYAEHKSITTETDASSQDQYAEHVTYNPDGTAIYTDPETNFEYKWCTKANNWIPNDNSSTTSANPYENEHYRWCKESQKWIPKQNQLTETEHYKWDSEKNQWIAKAATTNSKTEGTNSTDIVYNVDEDGQRTYTDKDGTVFFWDVDKNAWFPKIDDDFMARYQMSYGFIDNTSASEKEKEKLEQENIVEKQKELAKMVEEAKANEEAAKDTTKQGLKRKGQQEPPKWFEINPEHNTKVYVSNLPLDITLDEFAEVMSKCGMIMRDPQTQKYKLKLYTEADGQIKGDGLCDYIKVESVDLALKILDEYDLRGHKIRVQPAQFQMRGEYNPALKPKRKKKDKEKLAKIKEKLFDWRPEKMRGERSKHERTVIIKNLFHPDLFEKEVQLILDYQNDLREECSKCGTVRKVVIYDRHSEGVAQVNMSSPEEADMVIQMMQGRFFGKRQLTAEHWDGKTKYKVEETEEEIQKRLNKWDQYLEMEENRKTELQQNEKEKDLTETANDE